MKIEIEIEDAVYEAAKRYTLNPTEHLKSMLVTWQAAAQQQHPGLDLMTLPTLAEKEVTRQAERAAQQKQAEVDALIRKQKETLAQAAEKEAVDKQAAELEAKQSAAMEARAVELAKLMVKNQI